jgi:predicted thioesterase
MPEITLANVEEVGAAIRRDIKVDGGRTPSILSDIEFACRDILLSMLEAGQDSLGSHVSLNHVGAVVLGGTTTVAANISKLEKRRVTFERL